MTCYWGWVRKDFHTWEVVCHCKDSVPWSAYHGCWNWLHEHQQDWEEQASMVVLPAGECPVNGMQLQG